MHAFFTNHPEGRNWLFGDECSAVILVAGLLLLVVGGFVYGIFFVFALAGPAVLFYVRRRCRWYWPEVERYKIVDWQDELDELRSRQQPMEAVSVSNVNVV